MSCHTALNPVFKKKYNLSHVTAQIWNAQQFSLNFGDFGNSPHPYSEKLMVILQFIRSFTFYSLGLLFQLAGKAK